MSQYSYHELQLKRLQKLIKKRHNSLQRYQRCKFSSDPTPVYWFLTMGYGLQRRVWEWRFCCRQHLNPHVDIDSILASFANFLHTWLLSGDGRLAIILSSFPELPTGASSPARCGRNFCCKYGGSFCHNRPCEEGSSCRGFNVRLLGHCHLMVMYLLLVNIARHVVMMLIMMHVVDAGRHVVMMHAS